MLFGICNPEFHSGWVEREEHYVWSSAAGYFGIKKGMLELADFG
ncbi:hypothetical protein SAMN04489724_3396 [Algoriphagus locisalis]|uniref:Uncharacterized protein n=1 Tax=Algoriphagus locisalis TaxID=305507 RepID=A0A1I7CSX5_9BACT|nr:hypothetical protein SAMN04489724_3396 [Algoriphagus locisalis]